MPFSLVTSEKEGLFGLTKEIDVTILNNHSDCFSRGVHREAAECTF